MTDLRAALIEAGAEAIDDRLDGDRWTTEQFAEACLDAFLDVLADRTDEWAEAGSDAPPALLMARLMAADRLIAVLRGDT